MQLIGGNLIDAFAVNPLIAATLVMFLLWSFSWAAFGVKIETTLAPRTISIGVAILLFANWIYLLSPF